MKTLALIGKPYPHIISFLAEEHPELRLIAFQDLTDAFTYPNEIQAVYTIDFSSRDTIFAALSAIRESEVVGVMTQFENFVLTQALIGDYYGVPVLSEDAALAATDKQLMRQLFTKKNPAITPDFKAVSSWREVEQFAQEYSFPLILKPANLAKSLLVTKSTTIKELKENFSSAQEKIAGIYTQYGVHHRQPQLIIEEFLEGPSFSIDLAVDGKGNIASAPVVDLVMARDIDVADNYNYSRKLPTSIEKSTQEALIAVANEGVQALGLTNSAAHVELVLTKSGPKLIEIGARFGGYRPRMYELSYGLNIHQIILDLSLGKPIEMKPEFKGYVAVYEIFPNKEGILERFDAIEEVQALRSFHSISLPKQVGDRVGLSSQGYKFCASIFLHAVDKQQFEADCQFIENNVRALVQS